MICAIGRAVLVAGTLLIAAPQWGRRESGMGRCLRILRSEDGGGTWEEMPTLSLIAV